MQFTQTNRNGGDVNNLNTAAIRDAVMGEREACARLAETHPFSPAQMDDGARAEIAAAIRARTED